MIELKKITERGLQHILTHHCFQTLFTRFILLRPSLVINEHKSEAQLMQSSLDSEAFDNQTTITTTTTSFDFFRTESKASKSAQQPTDDSICSIQ